VRVFAAQLGGPGLSVARLVNRAGLAACLVVIGSVGAQHAKAVGDTRTLSMHHMHTDESINITYKKNGQFDEDALKKINWFLRDWRKSEATTMDPQEIDLLWEVHQEVGTKEPIEIVCGYRSPGTNEMLRTRSKNTGVARHSQHTLGKAIDFYIPGVPLEKLRETAMRVQGGGVGYYPTSGSPFVHVDVGNVRAWPRMTREQLVKLFPDGRTVHLPSSGDPLPGYQLAKADLERGHREVDAPQKRSFLAKLFGRDKDAEEADDNATARETASDRGVTAKAEPNKASKPALIQLASAGEPVLTATRPVPLPPRRPTYQLAASDSRPAPAPREAPQLQLAALTPNQIVNTRGMWDTDSMTAPSDKVAAAETNALSVPGTRRLSAGRETTASIGPFNTQVRAVEDPIVQNRSTQDRVPSDVALAYAAQQADSKARAAAVVTSKSTASIANKTAEAVMTSRPTRANERLDDPWLRGLVLAQSLQNSLVVTQVGDPDFTSFTQFMRKPATSLLMTFSSDPHLGMTADQFSGSAVVFPATVTFSSRHASLR
jgi:uncharacterized protein YcbK (DUF882 family)